jgi:hypothetical protein
MEESIRDVKLTNRPLKVHGQGKYKSDRSRLDNRAKGFGVVNDGLLLKPLSHQAGFKTFHRTISKPLNFINPLVVDNMAMRGLGTKGPSVIGDKGVNFCFHGISPPRVKSSLAIACRFKIRKG